jgi:hypothetical protein
MERRACTELFGDPETRQLAPGRRLSSTDPMRVRGAWRQPLRAIAWNPSGGCGDDTLPSARWPDGSSRSSQWGRGSDPPSANTDDHESSASAVPRTQATAKWRCEWRTDTVGGLLELAHRGSHCCFRTGAAAYRTVAFQHARVKYLSTTSSQPPRPRNRTSGARPSPGPGLDADAARQSAYQGLHLSRRTWADASVIAGAAAHGRAT